MGIGKRIKEARLALNLTQEELAHILGVTKGAVANYENETSHPKEPVMYKMFEALNVDANYLFQDVVKIPVQKDISFAEYEHIKKYRALDPQGQEHVNTVLDWETKRTSTIAQKDSRIAELEQSNITQFPNRSYLEPVAAHKRTDIEVTEELQKADDDIMDNDDEWK